MARSFNGTSDKAVYSGAVVSGFPVTLAGWFYVQRNATNQTLFIIGHNGVADDLVRLFVQSTTAGVGLSNCFVAQRYDGAAAGDAISTTTAGVSSAWFHVCGVFASTSSSKIYVNGSLESTNTTSVTGIGSQDYTAVGVLKWSGSDIQYMNGRAAECAVWNAALSDAEVAVLGKGCAPSLIRPASLVSYWPMWGRISPEPDFTGGHAFTLTGTTQADHPRVIHPVRPQLVYVPAAAGGGFQAAWARGCNVLLQPGVMG